ncbi:MAG: hypothetical protein WCK27_29615, partial [Verrucomicrobiota bacterium]
ASRTRLLGWRTQSLWDCRALDLSVVPYGTDLAPNIRKANGGQAGVPDTNPKARPLAAPPTPSAPRPSWSLRPASPEA